jgi:hypothetical protein
VNIVGIIDLDSFSVQKTFFCRELGLITHGDTYGTSFHFKTPLCYEKLNKKDKIQVKFLQEHIHGLSLTDENAMDANMVDIIVKKFYDAYCVNENSILAYKGGSFERTLLSRLNIPSFNLELFGCPKAIEIFDEMPWLECCGQHSLLKNNKDTYKHCLRVEVEAFLHWLTKYWITKY